jgi:hypothetical protein
MRKILIEIELPHDIEDDYADVCAELVVEDLVETECGVKVLFDSNE